MAFRLLSTVVLFSVTRVSARMMSDSLAEIQVKDQATLQEAQFTFFMDAGHSSNIHIGHNDVEITQDRSWTARARSQDLIPIGSTVQATIQCPSGDTNGLSTGFYTSSMEGSGNQDEIDFEFLGNQRNSVQTNYFVNGLGHHETVIYMGFDCSDPGHIFSIYHGSDSIKWSIDNKVVREVLNSYDTPFLSKQLYAYLTLWDASSINGGAWTGNCTWGSAPFISTFSNISLSHTRSIPSPSSTPSTLSPYSPHSPPIPPQIVGSTARLVFDAGVAEHVQIDSSSLKIKLDRNGTGRARTQKLVPLGNTVQSSIQCPAGDTSGLVMAFYTSSKKGANGKDAINFEFLGDRKGLVQTNYFVSGVGLHEEIITLGFDCSKQGHHYAIYHGNDAVKWFIDGKVVRTVVSSGGIPFPSKKQYVYWSIWDASRYNPWAGVATYSDAPYTMTCRDNTISHGDSVPQV